MAIKCVYQANGFESRKEYLQTLAEKMEVPQMIVQELANLLGPEEDFDGLVSLLEEVAEMEQQL